MQINGIRYGRILAFNEKGAKLLRRIKKTECAKMPILTNINRDLAQHPDAGAATRLSLAKDVLASDLYNLAFSKDLYQNSDFVMKPAYVHQI